MSSQIQSKANQILEEAQRRTKETHQKHLEDQARRNELLNTMCEIDAVKDAAANIISVVVKQLEDERDATLKTLYEKKDTLIKHTPGLADMAKEMADAAVESATTVRKGSLGIVGKGLRKIVDASSTLVNDVKTGFNAA